MEYTKVDPELARAVEEASDPDERNLPVFLHLSQAPTGLDQEWLHILGVDEHVDTPCVVTATLTAREVEVLSNKPWIATIRLSRAMHLL